MSAIVQLWHIIRMLLLSIYVFLESINTIYKYVTLGLFSEMYITFQFLGPGANLAFVPIKDINKNY